MTKVTKEQIAMWKKQYGDVFEVTAGDKACYLKRPDRHTLKAADAIGSEDPMRYNEILLENCWIDGDTEMKTNDNYFMQVVLVLIEMVEFRKGNYKKL